MADGIHDQSAYRARFEWGEAGLAALAPAADAIVIVDVLSFTTAVDIAVARGATVFPCGFRDGSAARVAERVGGVVAGTPAAQGASLSPSTLTRVPSGLRLVVESINGSAIANAAPKNAHVFAACLRNATAVASRLCDFESVAVIAAGERWPDGSIRYAVEDLLGAGAVIEALGFAPSPEAAVAVRAFRAELSGLHEVLMSCASGRELLARGRSDDVALAADHDVSAAVPRLEHSGFQSAPAN